MRAQIARHRINGLVFLFDAERKGWTQCNLPNPQIEDSFASL
jgi:hypothetical protein